MDWFHINNIAFEILDYPLSYIELIGTLFGLISVYLASRANILTWPMGILNEVAFFSLFYQVQLYSDMYLQVYFFLISVYGWYYWKQKPIDNSISTLSKKALVFYGLALVFGTVSTGMIVSQIHIWLPQIFHKPASYPFADAFTTIASILATILLSRKQIETWIFWIAVDIVSILLYVLKGIHLVAIEYFIFLLICMFGYFNWKKKL